MNTPIEATSVKTFSFLFVFTCDTSKHIFTMECRVGIQDICPEEDWNDEDRVNGLFSPFRDKNLNPELWQAKMTFWTNALGDWLAKTASISFSISKIQNNLCSKINRKPHCLETVIKQMEDKGVLIKHGQLQSNWDLKQSSWAQWSIKQTKRGLGNLVSKVWSDTKDPNEITYVHMPTLEALSQQTLRDLAKSKLGYQFNDTLLVKKEDLKIKEDIVDIVIGHLCNQRQCVMYEVQGITYIKISLLKSKVTADESNDRGVISLWKLNVEMEEAVKSLNETESKLKEQIKQLLKSGKRHSAKSTLKRLKTVQLQIDQKTKVCDNLNTMLMQIQAAADQAKIISSYRTGLNALKSQLAEAPSVEETDHELSEIADCIKQVELITGVISQSDFDIEATSDQELERELNELLDQDVGTLVDQLNDIHLPTTSPKVKTTDPKIPSLSS